MVYTQSTFLGRVRERIILFLPFLKTSYRDRVSVLIQRFSQFFSSSSCSPGRDVSIETERKIGKLILTAYAAARIEVGDCVRFDRPGNRIADL